MRRGLTFLLLAALAIVTACNDAAKPPVIVKSTPTPQAPKVDSHGHDDGHDAPRISLADAKKDFDAKTAVFIDTHAPEQYAQRHIPGSINVPANDIEPYLNKIPKGKKIIAYCSWGDEHSSASLVAALQKKGFDNAYALLGGTRAWVDAGYPMETSNGKKWKSESVKK